MADKTAQELARWERIKQLTAALELIADYDAAEQEGHLDEWQEAAAFRHCQEIAKKALGRIAP